ncbi:MAG: hypothetical protein CFE24_10985 [Flavobacterium sp. BFFFF2]|nr:MAG: hypothetical protein CFE24_10985 [Flavobacterium sp. BFFFF2]
MKKITFLITLFAISFGMAQPTTNASVPTNNPADVISVRSTTFANNIATNYNPNWSQSGTVDNAFDPGTGRLLLKYANFNYQGTEVTTVNAAGMEFLHIDIWTSNATDVKVSPINNGSGVSETLVSVPLVTNGWSSVDLPKSAFTGMTWDSVFQLKFDGQAGVSPSTIYLDNIYFWKTPLAPGSDSTLSDLKVNGTTIAGFTSTALAYNYEMVVGTTAVPQITATTTDPTATITSITQATAIPGMAYVLVTSQNGNVTSTYTVAFTASLPNPSPIPSTPPAQVLSVYGDTGDFTNIWTPSYNFGSNLGTPNLDPNGMNRAIKMNFAIAGYGEGTNTPTDISNYNYVHFDYFADNQSTEIRFILIGGGEFVYELTTTGSNGTIIPGSWQSVNVPLSFFTNIGFSKSNYLQYKLGTLGNMSSKIVYFDNIYFSVNPGTFLGNDSFTSTGFRMYPNPVNSVLNLSSASAIDQVQVLNTLGQVVANERFSSTEAVLNVSELPKGIYIISVQSGSEVTKKQFIKE